MANVPLLAEILGSEGSGPRVVPGAAAVVLSSVADVSAVALPPVLVPSMSGAPPASGVALPSVLVPSMSGVLPVLGVLLLPPTVVMPPLADVPPVPGVLLPPVADVPPVVILAVLDAPPVAPSSDVPPDEDSAPIAPTLEAPPGCPGAWAACDASSSVEQAETAHTKSGANRTGLIAGFFTFPLCHGPEGSGTDSTGFTRSVGVQIEDSRAAQVEVVIGRGWIEPLDATHRAVGLFERQLG